jgi:predicted DNA-binding transcriptional regulator AlpA
VSEQTSLNQSQPPSAVTLATAKPWEACGISRAQWYKLSASGRTPLPVRLGTRRPVYRIAELESWLKAGAPDRQTWQRLREASHEQN